jgi:hypothetical protein
LIQKLLVGMIERVREGKMKVQTIDSHIRHAIAQAYAKEKSLEVVAKQFGVDVETVRDVIEPKWQDRFMLDVDWFGEQRPIKW